ncbi:MAG: asparagine synthase (glutamine-hydrolyzing) [Flavobacteriales bacterium]
MCGIAGTYHLGSALAPEDDRIQAALACIAHRGPDDEGIYRKGSAVLGHRRLSVIDTTEAGHQPFTDHGGRYTIVFNGEVFNYKELRAQLEVMGHSFRSHTDTEVVLRLFAVKGEDFLHDLNGFFALAIHDAQEDSLFLARDRFGVKPLLWAETDGRFLFASELRALLAMGVAVKPDRLAMEQYLSFHYIPAPWTAVEGAHKLLPGHALRVSTKGVEEFAWYDLVKASKASRPTKDVQRTLYELLDDAVKLRLVADVPVGTFLSGGVDSSIVSALAAKHHAGLHTFSIGYADDPHFDESAYAEEVAAHIGSKHHTFKLSREELAEAYPRLLEAVDEPFADSSALPSFVLCERTRKYVTVALSGDGADEVFGGYRKHQAELRWQSPGATERAVRLLAPLWSALPKSRNSAWQDRFRQYDRFARLAGSSAEERFLSLAAFTPRIEAHALCALPGPTEQLALRDQQLTQALGHMSGMSGMLLADVMGTLPNDMLHKVDLTSMAHALEVRTPFLDKRVVEFAFGLPAEAKLRKGSGKYILRDTFGHLLPTTVMTRAKRGFEVPLLDLLRGPLKHLVDGLLDAKAMRDAGLEPASVTAEVARLRSTDPGTTQATLHALLVYLAWWKRHSA